VLAGCRACFSIRSTALTSPPNHRNIKHHPLLESMSDLAQQHHDHHFPRSHFLNSVCTTWPTCDFLSCRPVPRHYDDYMMARPGRERLLSDNARERSAKSPNCRPLSSASRAKRCKPSRADSRAKQIRTRSNWMRQTLQPDQPVSFALTRTRKAAPVQWR